MASLVDHASADCKQQNMRELSDKQGKKGSIPRFSEVSAEERGEPCPPSVSNAESYCNALPEALYAITSKHSAIRAIRVS